ncbi:MAG: putative phosphodiesterase [Akkermansiaceae bacterium]|jgi:predicted phosphodiesterase
MRYAIVSDIHANIRAWDAVFVDLRSRGAEVIVCLGDVVGYGPKPAEVLEAVRSVTDHFVMGNHDAAAVGVMDYSIFNKHARQAIAWTMTELSPEAKQFLASVPLAIEAGEIFFVHAEISEPGRFDYIDSVEIAEQNFAGNEHFVSFVGHTHLPKIFERADDGSVRELLDETRSLDPQRRYIVNVGSVGEPRNPDDLRARYVVYDSETREVDFRRVEFDIVAYREDLEATTLTLRPYFLKVYEQVIEGRQVVVSSGGSLVDMRVAHDSAALVDLGHQSNVVQFNHSGLLRNSAKTSRTPPIILAAVAAIALAAFAYWVFGSGSPAPKIQQPVLVVVEEKERPSPIEREQAEEETREDSIAEVSATESGVTLPEPRKPKPEPEPEPPAAKPIPEPPKKAIQSVWWRMDANAEKGPLIDEAGLVKLVAVENGRAIPGIAPDPVPLSQTENKWALFNGIWKEAKVNEIFALSSKHSFTFEGWFATKPTRRPLFLVGTRTGEGEDNRGWRIDLLPPTRGRREGQMSFFYDSGGKRIQALAEAVTVADSKPHHFAAIWNHDTSGGDGEMKLYLDGLEVASAIVPLSDIPGEQVNPLRIGAEANPKLLALDELRFTRRALGPHQFLLKTPVLGIKLVKSDPQSRDSWGTPDNWEGGVIPGGDDNVIIAEGLTTQAQNSPPNSYTGSLVLKQKATVILWTDDTLTALPTAPSPLVMHQHSRLILRTKDAIFGPLDLIEDAQIWGGASTSGHNTIRSFKGEIKGDGKLTLNGVSGNQFRLETANSFTGGCFVHSTQKQPFFVVAATDSAFGTGDVELKDKCSLVIEPNHTDTIADTATLRLDGAGSLRMQGAVANQLYKLVLNSDETVSGFFIDGQNLGEGVYSSETHPEIGGPGKLTVKPTHD